MRRDPKFRIPKSAFRIKKGSAREPFLSVQIQFVVSASTSRDAR